MTTEDNRRPLLHAGLALMLALATSGCSLSSKWAYRNAPLPAPTPAVRLATFNVNNTRGGKAPNKVLVLLALSGGGSRAAYFSEQSMFKLEKVLAPDYDVLSKVDLISSVSGGSLTAAYYCLSRDPDASETQSDTAGLWTEEAFRKLIDHDYIFGYRGLIVGGYIIRPYNLPRSWFTAYTRTDVMADVFENGVYEPSSLKFGSPTFADLNSQRPFLILNAGNGTQDYGVEKFGTPFTFTEQGFRNICSDIYSYPLAYGVMASAAFPGVFNYMTLADFSLQTPSGGRPATHKRPPDCPTTPDQGPSAYLHLFDGGTVDNLGLESVRQVIIDQRDNYDYFVVISVDSYQQSGSDRTKPDVRGFWGHLIDSDALTTYDSLLTSNRDDIVAEFSGGDLKIEDSAGPKQPKANGAPSGEEKTHRKKPQIVFWHVTFDNIKDSSLKQRIESIPTDFSLTDESRHAIEDAAGYLIKKNDPCLNEIRQVIETGQKPPHDDACSAENKGYQTKHERLRTRELQM